MKKKYIFPSTVIYTLHIGPMLNNVSSIPVNDDEEGDQSEAESRSLRHRSVWDEEEE